MKFHYNFHAYSNCDLIRTRVTDTLEYDVPSSCEHFEGNSTHVVGSAVLTAVAVSSNVAWDIVSCSPLKIERSFRGAYRLHPQARNVSGGGNQHGQKNCRKKNIFFGRKLERRLRHMCSHISYSSPLSLPGYDAVTRNWTNAMQTAAARSIEIGSRTCTCDSLSPHYCSALCPPFGKNQILHYSRFPYCAIASAYTHTYIITGSIYFHVCHFTTCLVLSHI